MNPDRHPVLALRPAQRRLLARQLYALARPPAPTAWQAMLGRRRKQVSGEMVVLAAGLLLSARAGLSASLVARVVGRGRGAQAVREALGWLMTAGLLEGTPALPDVLRPTDAALKLLRSLDVPPPPQRHHGDLSVPAHLAPLLSPPDAQPWRVAVSPPARLDPRGTSRAALPEPGKPPRAATNRGRAMRSRWVAVVLGGGLVAGALWWQDHPASRDGLATRWTFAVESSPTSRGTLIQLDRRGLMLSMFGGDMFSSTPDRLDFKNPLRFTGFDMAADCGLVSPQLRQVALSPDGRFLLTDAARPGKTERCLVDLETLTVTHDLPRRAAVAASPHVVGWLSPTELALADRATPASSTWHILDVTSGRTRSLTPTRSPLALRLEVAGGPSMVAGLTPPSGPTGWQLTGSWWSEGGTFEQGATVRLDGAPPSSYRPARGALSPDRRLVLLAWAGPGPVGRLTVTALSTGETAAVPLTLAPDLGAPVFWSPDTRAGTYRCWATLKGPDGPQPCTIELTVPPEDALPGQTTADRSASP